MAVDTAAKRRSIPRIPGVVYQFPAADGTVDEFDRRQAAGFYRGVVPVYTVRYMTGGILVGPMGSGRLIGPMGSGMLVGPMGSGRLVEEE